MTDREAIECFESHCKNCSIKDECKRLKEKGKLVCRNTNAISALQERIDRERGCEFCSDNFDFWASEISGYFDRKDIKFCLHCGRKLKTSMPGEEV
jgi:hypothetical protein